MFRIGRIFDLATPAEKAKLDQVQAIFRKAFPTSLEYAAKVPELLAARGKKYEFIILTAEEGHDRVLGFAIVHYHADLKFGYLDYLASDPDRRDSGVGGALYEAVREYLDRKGAKGMFMEVPPDDAALLIDAKASLPQNRARLKFYEQYGAFPIAGTKYETLAPGSPPFDPPYLVYDSLGKNGRLSRADARHMVEAIFVRKYGYDQSNAYFRGVLASFADDPVRLREPKYAASAALVKPKHGRLHPLKVVVAEHHEIHHVRERGYVERPARVDAILKGLADLNIDKRMTKPSGEKPIRAVHDGDFVSFLGDACKKLGPKETVYPYVFPIRNPDRKPKDKALRAGYYCIDTFTPLSLGAYKAARAAVDCAMTGAELILQGEHLVYSLCRPPGHHAERRVYGGFCYFSNAAIAAQHLSQRGKVAVLDVDFHHGNGSQDIFYRRSDVLTVSIHGHPNKSYPYFTGFADEKGEGAGLGYNINYPLPEGVDDNTYLGVLAVALKEVRKFKPAYLVVSLGFDIMRGDPTGSFVVTGRGMQSIGSKIAELDLPTLVVQEGGYSIRNLVRGSEAFFSGLSRGWFD